MNTSIGNLSSKIVGNSLISLGAGMGGGGGGHTPSLLHTSSAKLESTGMSKYNET